MANAYAKRPTVTRYTSKPTYAGRDVKRTSVVRREVPGVKGRPMRSMRPMREGR